MDENELRTGDFDYDLPPGLVATHPVETRDGARMMIVDRAKGSIRHGLFSEFVSVPGAGDLVVLNDTKVVRARFFADDGRLELLRLDRDRLGRWRCLVRPGRRLRIGREIVIGGRRGMVEDVSADGSRVIRWDEEPEDAVHGHLALPHYIGRPNDAGDADRYQTVFADPAKSGAIAAPTAGLHFTPEILSRIRHAFVTLHVGVGTFRPVQAERVSDHRMHAERFEIPPETAALIAGARRVIAIGTTVARVLEHAAAGGGPLTAGSGMTSIFIFPGFRFLATGALLTNFHLPRSTLLMLVSAFAGRELTRRAYAEAVRERYRFFSYGDCMLII